MGGASEEVKALRGANAGARAERTLGVDIALGKIQAMREGKGNGIARLSDGDVIVLDVSSAREDDRVAGNGERAPRTRLACASAPTRKEGEVKYAFAACDDVMGNGVRGMYMTIHDEAPMVRFESKAMTAAAHWELAESRREKGGGTRFVLRSCARRDVRIEGVMNREYTPIDVFETWAAFIGVVEQEEMVQEEFEREANDLLAKLAAGFLRELNTIEQQVNAASRAKLGPRIVQEYSPDDNERKEEMPLVVKKREKNLFESLVATPTADVAPAKMLESLPPLERRSTQVNPSTPLDDEGKETVPPTFKPREQLVLSDEDFPSPSDQEIAAVRDESWRFQSSGKKSTKTLATPSSTLSTPRLNSDTPGMSSKWDFSTPNSNGSVKSDESFYSDVGGLDTPSGAKNSKFASMASSFEGKNALTGNFGQLSEDEYEIAAVRKSGIDPKSVVSTPGGTSAMLKYVGRMFVSQFRSEMNILNVPFVTLDEVTMDFIELVETKKKAGFKSKLANVSAINEFYIAAMSVNNFTELLREFGDEDGYTEILTLKRALAIAITTKGAVADNEFDSENEM